MATLKQLGVTTQRQFLTDTAGLQLGALEVGGTTRKTTKLTLTLPTASAVKAEFSAEGVAKKITKFFRHELQTGDAIFDGAVYITTDTQEATACFLMSPDVRVLVAALVAIGPVQINANTVTAVTLYHSYDDDENVTNLVGAVLR